MRVDMHLLGSLRPLSPVLRRFMQRIWDQDLRTIKAVVEPPSLSDPRWTEGGR
jgi:hypothetical protein